MMEKTDAELVALAREGNRDAFSSLIERYTQMVNWLAAGMIADGVIACELAQESMVQAYLSLDHLRDAARFKSWLYGITLNVCRSYLRERQADVLSLESLLGGMHAGGYDHTALLNGAIDPQVIAEERELRALVLQAVQHLSPKERAVTLLFYYEQYTLQEIATLLALSVTAVKGRLHRARKQLRAQLASLYDVLPQERRRNKQMKRATIESVREHPETQQHVVILKDDSNQELVIHIGKPEAWAIAGGLSEFEQPRPMTAQLMANLLQATGSQLEEVRIDSLKDEVFYATLKIRGPRGEQELDARPSDALSLAVLVKCPIYVADEVMQRCAQSDVSESWLRPASEFHVIDRAALEKDQEERKLAMRQAIARVSELSARQHKQEQEQARQARVAEWKEERSAGQE
jgi:RNA polymerase sigma factor (sigma-70 family)